jgi:23S rRNA pseudouridine2605 synthase
MLRIHPIKEQSKNRKTCMTKLRLNKALSSAGLCSRRKADERILAGLVTVNGVVVTEPGTQIIPGQDTVTVDKRTISLPMGAAAQEHCHIVLHKPIQVVSTAHDPEGRTTVLDLLPDSLLKKRLYPVGRLDYFSEGLLLLTNDGELTNRLTHPRYHLPKIYEVKVRELPGKDVLERIRQGITLHEGEKLAPMRVELMPDTPHIFLLTLYQGINRQIRRLCRDLGLTILTLRRVQMGPLHLGTLAKGEYRPLQLHELTELRRAVGLG